MWLKPVVAWSDLARMGAAVLIPIALLALMCWWGRSTPEQDARVVARVVQR